MQKTDDVLSCLDAKTQEKFRSMTKSLSKDTLAKEVIAYGVNEESIPKNRLRIINILMQGGQLAPELELVDFQRDKLEELLRQWQAQPDVIQLEKENFEAHQVDDDQLFAEVARKEAVIIERFLKI